MEGSAINENLKVDLLHAVEEEDIAKLGQLIDDNPSCLQLPIDVHGRTVVHHICANGHLPAVQWIVSLCKSQNMANALSTPDDHGHNSVHHSLVGGHHACLDHLLTLGGTDVNAADEQKHTAMHWAVVSADAKAVEMLLHNHAMPSLPNLDGITALHYATQLVDVEAGGKIMSLLLGAHASVDAPDDHERSPMIWAANAGSTWAVAQLLDHGAKVDAVEGERLGVLHCAASRGHDELIQYIMANKGDRVNIDTKDVHGATPLFYAAAHGHVETVGLLLGNNADADSHDCKLRTALHCAASKGQMDCIRMLVERGGASVSLQNIKGDLPIHEAAFIGNVDVCEYLLRRHPTSLHATNHGNRSCLHLAAASGSVSLCRHFVQQGIHVNALMVVGSTTLTPLDIARARGREEVEEYLQRHNAKASVELTAGERQRAIEETTVQRTKAAAQRDSHKSVRFAKGSKPRSQRHRRPRGKGSKRSNSLAPPTGVDVHDVGTSTDVDDDQMAIMQTRHAMVTNTASTSHKTHDGDGGNSTVTHEANILRHGQTGRPVEECRLIMELSNIGDLRRQTATGNQGAVVRQMVHRLHSELHLRHGGDTMQTFAQWESFVCAQLRSMYGAEAKGGRRPLPDKAFNARLARRTIRNSVREGDTYFRTYGALVPIWVEKGAVQ